MSVVLEYLKDHDWEGLRQRLDTLAGYARAPMPQARVYRTAAFSAVAVGSDVILPWDSVTYNKGAMWNVASPTRLTIPITGLYLVMAGITVTTLPVAGSRILPYITWTGGNAITRLPTMLAGSGESAAGTMFQLSKGDYVEFHLWNVTAGGPITPFSGDGATWFEATRLGGFANEGVA